MRTNTCTCDHCGTPLKIETAGYFGMHDPNSLKVEAVQVSLKAGKQGGGSYFRDFCNEGCLRDFLVKYLPAEPAKKKKVRGW